MSLQRALRIITFITSLALFCSSFAVSAPLAHGTVDGRRTGTLVAEKMVEEETSQTTSRTTTAPDFREELEQTIVASEPLPVAAQDGSLPAAANKGKREATEPATETTTTETTTTDTTTTQCQTQTQSISCIQEFESNLRDDFYRANRQGSPVVQKLRQGDRVSNIGSAKIQEQALETECVDEIRLDYDANRFPQYLMQTTCLQASKCSGIVEQKDIYLRTLRLNTTECNTNGYQKYDVSTPQPISVCTRVQS